MRLQRGLEVSGRVLLMAGILPPAWLGGVAALSLAKILDNMEIGHNVMHGQYDWMQDPALDSATFEWDTACPADQWRHSHNYVHHTFTNVLGQDRDVGYGLLRMTDEQRWHPRDLGNPVYALALAALFQWGVALHDVELDRVVAGTKTPAEAREKVEGVWRKARTQVLKDYALYPALAGPAAPVVLSGNLTANLVRNLWTFAVIFCGHFPDGVETFTPEEAEGEGRGGWYRRQLLGSANFRGGPLLHLLTGNLSHQIEHHMFPDLPAHRYAEIAEQVRAVCAEHGLPYNTGTFPGQLGTVARRIASLALPGREDEPVASRLGQLVGRLNPLGR
ncbi:acyl-CoA desaturase [Iamia sp. SCSIO 61187]|uniref:fatty acid desaturase family protein n=1 Tax=Iamia sp. SCSIO 61187 TaxID=2722752 RepID=UPI001C62B8F1|nr:acyl-CoA desaturase [Iamia sp. SCSIO 61187]